MGYGNFFESAKSVTLPGNMRARLDPVLAILKPRWPLTGYVKGPLECNPHAGDCPLIKEPPDQRDAMRHGAGRRELRQRMARSGAQSLRASDTSTNPARSVSEGCPVKLVMVSISSRKRGHKQQVHLGEDPGHLCSPPCAGTGRPARNPRRKENGPAGKGWATRRASEP